MLKKEASTEQINRKDPFEGLIPCLEKGLTRIEKGFTFIADAYHALRESTIRSELRASIKLIIWMLVIGYALKGGAQLLIEASSLGWTTALTEFFNTSSDEVLFILPFVFSCLFFVLSGCVGVILLKRWHEYSPLTSNEHYLLVKQLKSWGIEGRHIKSGLTYNWDEVLDVILSRYLMCDSEKDKKMYRGTYLVIRKHYNYLVTHAVTINNIEIFQH